MEDRKTTIDFEGFRQSTGLDEETVKELYQGFLEELLEEKEKLMAQLQNGEYDRLAKTVHNLKGISSSYMAVNVYRQSLELDTLIKRKKTNDIEILVNRLVSDIIEAAGDIVGQYRL